MVEILLDAALREEELFCDLAVAQPLAQQRGDLPFPLGQRVESRGVQRLPAQGGAARFIVRAAGGCPRKKRRLREAGIETREIAMIFCERQDQPVRLGLSAGRLQQPEGFIPFLQCRRTCRATRS